MMLAGNWKWQEILKGQGVKVPFSDLFKAYIATFSIRFLAPIILVAAELFQGYALKEKNSLSWSKAMASVVIDRASEWTANIAVIFFGTLFFLSTISLPPLRLLIVFGGVFLFFAAGIFYFYFKIFKRESMAKVFGKIFNNRLNGQPLEIEREVFNFFHPGKIEMWKVFGLSFLRAAIMLARTWVLIIFLGQNIGALPSLSVLGFTYLATMIPIPTALGSHEAIQIFAFDSLGLSLGAATAFTMIIRAAELLLALLGLIILSQLGIRLLKKALFRESIDKNNF